MAVGGAEILPLKLSGVGADAQDGACRWVIITLVGVDDPSPKAILEFDLVAHISNGLLTLIKPKRSGQFGFRPIIRPFDSLPDAGSVPGSRDRPGLAIC